MIEKLRINNDARYYRNLLYKSECRHNHMMSELRSIKASHKVMCHALDICKTQQFVLIVLHFLMIIFVYKQDIKDLVYTVHYHDYTSAMLHMWKDYWKQVPSILGLAQGWQVFK